MYDGDGNVAKSGRASVSGLSYSNNTNNPYILNLKGDINIRLSTDVADPLVWYAAAINDNLDFKITTNGSVYLSGSIDGFPAHEIWVNSGNGYSLIYSFYGGGIINLGPIYGNRWVSGSNK